MRCGLGWSLGVGFGMFVGGEGLGIGRCFIVFACS